MKRSGAYVTVLALFILIGCQENNLTNPINGNESLNRITGSKLGGDVIGLSGEVQWKDKDGVAGIWTIDGQAAYTTTPNPKGYTVEISVKGTLTPMYVEGDKGMVEGESADLIIGIGSKPITLEKEFVFDSGYGKQVLHISFSVSDELVSVESMWATQLEIVRAQ